MTYYQWMIRNYKNDANPAGKLARDMKRDPSFPRKDVRDGILDYLIRHDAERSCIRAFDETWRIYARQERWKRTKPIEGRRRIRGGLRR